MNSYSVTDVGGIKRQIEEFDRRHGESIFHDGWIMFADGAYREGNPLGLMVEPPANPHDRAKRKALFHKVLFERAVKAFDLAKSNYREHVRQNTSGADCGFLSYSPAQATEELVGLRNRALAAKAKYDEALIEVEACKPERERARAKDNARNRKMNDEFSNAIEKVQL